VGGHAAIEVLDVLDPTRDVALFVTGRPDPEGCWTPALRGVGSNTVRAFDHPEELSSRVPNRVQPPPRPGEHLVHLVGVRRHHQYAAITPVEADGSWKVIGQ
jgi:hypothetical protein